MASSTKRTIAVVGATGRQGGQVVRHLLADGWRVRALSRTPAGKKGAELGGLGADVVYADLEDAASLDVAFADVSGVFVMQPPGSRSIEIEVGQGINAANAAARAGVAHVVYGSAGPGNTETGVQQWDAKLRVARGMEDLGLPLTVLRPMAFMELMVDPSFYPQSSTWYTMPRLAGVDSRIPWLSVRDLGAVAARAFAEPERFIGKDLRLAADVKSLAECRRVFREGRGKNPPRFPMPLFLFRRFVGDDILTMWRWLRENPVDADTGPTYEVLPTAMDVQAFLQAVR
ncbi:NmrA family NAD(P)-binding protein [Agromyces sp. Marseille-P2726]|uniref:NmrA family NAD(P)-binding protein n=1 Tax=Agromyces sp. Marseille-P2726 TaxID=2709132 RepID=UPI0015704804|nr:NmrA family NAD(P)-binding protein [Agromyces sp. Marseille-P2726]